MLVKAITEDIYVDDIRLSIPRGDPVVIPANLVCDSTDLGRLISSQRLMKLDINPRLDNKLSTQPRVAHVPTPVAPSDNSQELFELRSQLQAAQASLKTMTSEGQKLNSDLESSRTECGQLLAEGSKLRGELAKHREEDSKLSTILGKLDNLPTQVVVQAAPGSSMNTPLDGSLSEDDPAPIFIQNFDPPKKLTVKTSTSDSDTVSKATAALGELRKKKGR